MASTTASSSPGLNSPTLSGDSLSPAGARDAVPDALGQAHRESTQILPSPPYVMSPPMAEGGLSPALLISPTHIRAMVSPLRSFSRQTNYDFTMHDGLSDASSAASRTGESELDNAHQLLSMQGAIEKSAGDRLQSRRALHQSASDGLFEQTSANSFRPQSATPVPASDPGLSLPTAKDEPSSRDSSDNGSLTPLDIPLILHGDASAYEHFQVSEEISGLFQYIDSFKPQGVEIGTILRPFIPDYIPAVGAIDEFLKVPRPDGVPDHLGLKVLDESGPKQSDPAVVSLQLRAASMQASQFPLQVSSLENADKNPKKIDAWITSIRDLHRNNPPPSVIYSKPMPDIDKLMQEWPPEIEKVLEEVELPSAKLDVDLPTFSDICCAILDIPVYKSRVESLHVMFSLYLEFKDQPQCADTVADWSSRQTLKATSSPL